MLSSTTIENVVRMALDEDAPWGDITSESLIPANAQAHAELVAREPGIFCGGEVFATAMRMTDCDTKTVLQVGEGDRFGIGDVLATVDGPARGILSAERVGLNLVQRMSAIATTTARYVAEVSGTKARIVDTRKTTPGLRALERYAVRCGGGHNHRNSLSDAVMAKDNHLAVITAGGAMSVTDALLKARSQLSHTTHIEVEVDRIDQIEQVLAAGVDTIMLDNFTLDGLRKGVALVAGRALVEASGGVELLSVGEVARTGVDLISVGALTHTVRIIDIGLDFNTGADAPAAID